MNVKFTFILKSGKEFESIAELTLEQFTEILSICKLAMQEDVSGHIGLPDCCVRLSDCSVVSWEVYTDE